MATPESTPLIAATRASNAVFSLGKGCEFDQLRRRSIVRSMPLQLSSYAGAFAAAATISQSRGEAKDGRAARSAMSSKKGMVLKRVAYSTNSPINTSLAGLSDKGGDHLMEFLPKV